MEVVDGHITLPENICGMDQLGCMTHDATYIWTKPHDLCEFESIRNIEVTEEDYTEEGSISKCWSQLPSRNDLAY